MDFVCDAANGKTWFRLTTEGEAVAESRLMGHAVEKHYRQFREAAIATYSPPASLPYIERDIGLSDHIRRAMPLFLTLRDENGAGLATAMLPPDGVRPDRFRCIVVGPSNTDPFAEHGEAIRALAAHFKIALDSALCYPYRRG
jgi:hypothetical protein